MGWIEDKIEHKLDHLASTIALENELTRDRFASGLAATVRGMRIDGALNRQIRPNASNYGAGGRLVGWSLRATGGEVIVTLHDGADTSGDVIGVLDLAAGTSQTVSMMPAGISFVDGLYAEVTGAGTLTGAVWLGAVD